MITTHLLMLVAAIAGWAVMGVLYEEGADLPPLLSYSCKIAFLLALAFLVPFAWSACKASDLMRSLRSRKLNRNE